MLLALAASALAAPRVARIELRAGNLILVGHGGFAPEALPKHENAGIVLFGAGHVATADDQLPPVLEKVIAEFDRHGALDTTGLGVCTTRQLLATTVVQARKVCGDAIVGKGVGRGVVKFPEQAPIPANSPITIFNGPRIHGDPSVLAHAYVTVPVPTTFIVPVRIETIHNGRYGYRVKARIPKIAGGSGIPISGSLKVGRQWMFKGKKHSFISAHCPDGHLQAIGTFRFKDGTRLQGTFVRPCKARG